MKNTTRIFGILLLAASLAYSGCVNAATAYNQFVPSNGILKGSTATPVTTAATWSDVQLLLSGTCNSSVFVRGDGTCVSLGITPAALTKADDTNVTLTLGGTPSTALLQATSITAGWTGTLAASRGGLGMSTVTDDTLPVANGTTWQSKALTDCDDTGGQHLNYDTGTNAFSCGTSGAVTGAALTKTDDTNVTLTLGGSPTTALVNAASITAGWTGTLAASRGGLGMSTVTDDTVAVANGTTWQSKAIADCDDTGGNHLNYDTGTNAFSCGTSGSVSGAALTRTNDTNITLTLGGSPTTALVNAASITAGWTGVLAEARGGTGVSSVASLGANPSASVGLTAVNGSAGTFMRSDGAPALDQSISPTWTGTHRFGTQAASSNAALSNRARGNAFEWGHSNTAGYGSTLGFESGSGKPFLAFHAEQGTNSNTYRTRGIPGSILSTNAAGAMTFGHVATASADNQTQVVDATMAADGGLFMAGAAGSSQGAGTINATAVYDDGVLLANAAGANPTGTVGLTAVNGSAGTFLRSDGAPALSQAIVPTWTGVHTFANQVTNLSSTGGPLLEFIDGDAGTDATRWRVQNANGQFRILPENDAGSGGANALAFARSSSSVTDVALGNATSNPTFSFLGTGAATFGGSVTGSPNVLAADGAVTTKIQSINSTSSGMVGTQSNHPLEVRTNNVIRATFPAAGGFTLSSGALLVPDGTASAPAVTFTSDTNTGIYSAGADIVGLATAGSNRVTVGPGVQVGAPTGGDKGAGTVNATGLYINGTAVGSGAAAQIVRKTANTARTSTTASADPHLSIATTNGVTYSIQGYLSLASLNNGNGLKFGIFSNSGASGCTTSVFYPNGSNAVQSKFQTTGSGVVSLTSITTASTDALQFSGTCASSGGNIELYWSADSSGSGTSVQSGSWLLITPIS